MSIGVPPAIVLHAFVQRAAAGLASWADVIQHVLTYGELKPGWLAGVPDLPALATSEPWGAQLAALEGLMPAALLATGVDPQRLRQVTEGYLHALEGAAPEVAGRELHVMRLRALCRSGRHPTG